MPVDITDVSSNNMHLTNNGQVQYAFEGLTPFYRFDSTNYLTYPDADAPEFNITGTESYVVSQRRGLTIMCWARFSTGSLGMLIAKEDTGLHQYGMGITAIGEPFFRVSGDGTALVTVTAPTSSVEQIEDWNFYCGHWQNLGGLVSMYVNDVQYTALSTLSPPLFSGAALFSLGSRNGNDLLFGDISMAGVYAAALSEDQILTIYDMTAPLFKVAL